MTGQSQKYAQPTTTTTTDFEVAERRAFEHVGESLRDMPFCCREDLEAAAVSYYAEGFRLQGVSVSPEYVQRKATKFADWWDEKHTAARTVRPHTRYTPKMAARGRVVSQIRRGTRADVDGLLSQLERLRGVSVAEIATDRGRTVQHARRLLKRTFSKLLVCIIIGTFGTSSVGFSSDLTTSKDLKEGLSNVRLDEGTPAAAVSLVNSVDLDAIGAAIPDLLRDWWGSKDT